MDNYSKVLTFFMENGITLTPDQLTALKEEFLGEATNSEEKNKKKLCNDIYHTLVKFFKKNKFNINDPYYPSKLSGHKQFIEGKSNQINIVSGIISHSYTTYARLESLNQVFNLYKNELLEELNDVSNKYNYSIKSITVNNGIFTIEFNNETVNESYLNEAYENVRIETYGNNPGELTDKEKAKIRSYSKKAVAAIKKYASELYEDWYDPDEKDKAWYATKKEVLGMVDKLFDTISYNKSSSKGFEVLYWVNALYSKNPKLSDKFFGNHSITYGFYLDPETLKIKEEIKPRLEG